MANLKVTLVKSTIGAVPKHKKTVGTWIKKSEQNSRITR